MDGDPNSGLRGQVVVKSCLGGVTSSLLMAFRGNDMREMQGGQEAAQNKSSLLATVCNMHSPSCIDTVNEHPWTNHEIF